MQSLQLRPMFNRPVCFGQARLLSKIPYDTVNSSLCVAIMGRDICMYFSIHAEIYKEYVAKIAIYNEDLTVS